MTLSVVEGEPATRIVEFVQNNDVDLIILSIHGGSGLTGWNISSVVQKTVIRVQKPTMIVRSYQIPDGGPGAISYKRLLNPIMHGQDPEKYRVEPYVVAADIYSTPPHNGRGGWTWYTGSAAWLYRLYLEGILGLQRKGEALHIDPRIPPSWPGFEITYRWGKSRYHIAVDNEESVSKGIQEIVLDGRVLPDTLIPLVDDGKEHQVRVRMGREHIVPMYKESGN